MSRHLERAKSGIMCCIDLQDHVSQLCMCGNNIVDGAQLGSVNLCKGFRTGTACRLRNIRLEVSRDDETHSNPNHIPLDLARFQFVDIPTNQRGVLGHA